MFKVFWKHFFPHVDQRMYGTVRYAFPVIFVAALFAGLAALVTEEKSYISIESSTENVRQDQEFYITVNVTSAVPVNAIDLSISYPQDQITVLGIDTGSSVITLWAEDPYAKDGQIHLRGGTFKRGFVGTHQIARVKVRATGSGNAQIIIGDTSLVAGDGSGKYLPVASNNARNKVSIAISGSDGLLEASAAIGVVTDTDHDGDVDVSDISRFMSAWFTNRLTYDFNGDGKMSFVDFSIILAESFFR